MNRKDYEALARALRAAKPPSCDATEAAGWFGAVMAVVALVAKDGQDKFLRACGVAHEPS